MEKKKRRDFFGGYLMPIKRLFYGSQYGRAGQELRERQWAMCGIDNPSSFMPHAASTSPGGLVLPGVDGGNTMHGFFPPIVSMICIAYHNLSEDALKIAEIKQDGTLEHLLDIPSTSDNQYHSISVFENSIYVVYIISSRLHIAISHNRGKTWEYSIIDSSTEYGRFNSVAAYDNDVYVGYIDENDYSIKIAVSHNKGRTWNIHSITASFAYGTTAIKISNKNPKKVFMSFIDYVDSGVEIKVICSYDKGETFNTVIAESSTTYPSYTDLVVNNDSVMVIYDHTDSPEQLKFLKATLNTSSLSSWSSSTIENLAGLIPAPCIASAGDKVFVSYSDDYKNIKIAKSEDVGNSWMIETIYVGTNTFDTAIVIKSNFYILVYQDNASPNGKLYEYLYNNGNVSLTLIDGNGDTGRYPKMSAWFS